MQCTYEEEKQEKGVVGRLSLKGDLVISELSALQEALRQGIETSDLLVVDCAGVSGIDTAGMQLLCSAHRSAVSSGKSLVAKNLKKGQLDDVLNEAGFVRHRACPLAPEGEPCLWVPEPAGQ